MELEYEGSIPFLGTVIARCGNTLKTEVYWKPTNTGLLHFQSHVDNRYKKGLVNTMVDRAYPLSSTEEALTKECDKLRIMFSKLRYPNTLVKSTIHRFMQETARAPHAATSSEPSVYYIKLPFKDQRSADRVCKDIISLGSMINVNLKPVFISRKLSQTLHECKGKQASDRQHPMRCILLIFIPMWFVWCKLCRFYCPTLTPTHQWTPLFYYRKTPSNTSNMTKAQRSITSLKS